MRQVWHGVVGTDFHPGTAPRFDPGITHVDVVNVHIVIAIHAVIHIIGIATDPRQRKRTFTHFQVLNTGTGTGNVPVFGIDDV
ncbi:hypothetical protein SRABI106_04869 [Rahnella aquatilis]|nr:hypothetical protein SRABI106_04869 [Rahnella aquatilis]